MRRMISEEGRHKKVWTYDELIGKFLEWYEIDVGEKYFREAIRLLIEEGILELHDNMYYYRG